MSFENRTATFSGLFDFHKIAFMKMTFEKHYSIERHYRNYRYFDQPRFKNDLKEKLSAGITNYESFETIFIEVLNKNVRLTKKFRRANHASYVTKTSKKAIMR